LHHAKADSVKPIRRAYVIPAKMGTEPGTTAVVSHSGLKAGRTSTARRPRRSISRPTRLG